MGVARNRRKIRLSKLYSYACFRPSEEGKKSNGEGEGLPFLPAGGPGFSRLVFCNHPHKHLTKPYNYGSNYVSTTKYNLLTFFPKSLFEQFRRVANLYFLFAAILSLTSLAPFKASTLIFPLIFVVGISMLKEVIEDTKRFLQDREVNARKVKRHAGEGAFEGTEWQKLHVGDVVMVEKDHFFPADLLLLSSSYPDGICYVETMNLDGETNLKLKKAKEDTLSLDDDFEFRSFKGSIRCEDPNPNLYTFVGSLDYQEFTYSLGPQQILLRDSKLRNTQFIYGVVIFTGHDTKVMQNATDPPSKRSRVEKKLDSIIYLLFSSLLAISVIGSIVYGILNEYDAPSWWYLQDYTTSDNPSDPFIASLLHLLTALILYGYLIPISLYVSIEIVKVLQSLFINQDVKMYYKEADKPAQARTSNLNEELGQVNTILTDKTGTLTCNQMDFVKCSIAGVSYGLGITEIAIAKKMQKDPQVDEATFKALELDLNVVDRDDKELTEFPLLKGFNFRDSRLMNGNWMLEADADVIATFFRILAICHTAIPEDEESDQINYEAESPDEGAFVVAAREFGFEFCKRTQTSVYIREPDCSTDNKITREYKILNLLEFNSTRKRMSVIIRDEKGQVFILCKGADSVILERLGKIGTKYEVQTRKDITTYGEAGLRTLALAYRKLEEAEYAEWNKLFLKAKTMVGASRDAELDAAAEMIEKDLILVGATAVEDKLQKGVPECIDKLAFAGIKIWVLTGDKMETAINIGFSCNLLRQGMQQIFLTLDTESVQEAESQGDKDIIAKVSFMTILQQVSSAQNQIIMETSPDAVFALIIDGKALTYALQENLKKQFLQLAVNCAAVVCCRVSPKQKALVTRLVKEGTNRNTLAIGDGANDVGMIQEADIGVGISGVEGMQAVMASDFSIAQFCFLERLLIVHGHWCYRRISTMICLFFYKNITFGLTLFCYEAYTSFSAQTAYNDWSMSFFNVLFTSLPVLSLGVFEQDVASDICLAFPTLYQQGPRNMLFGWDRILTWMGNGIYSAFTIFFFTNAISQHQSFRNDGHVPGLEEFGSMMYSCVVLTINLQIALATSHFTWIQHICIWGSICLWYIFLVVYGFISPLLSTTAYKVFVEALAPAPMYWYTIIFAPLVCILPYFTISALQKAFCPMDHHIIQEIRHMKKDLECSTMWSKYKANAAQKTAIGFTA